MVAADRSAEVVRDAIARGIPRVWLYRGFGPGAVSDEAVELCRTNGVEVVDGACPLMFEGGNGKVGGIHRLHHFLAKRHFAA
jgi:predicted CoA-binding protein